MLEPMSEQIDQLFRLDSDEDLWKEDYLDLVSID
jgi:hypothetical protein